MGVFLDCVRTQGLSSTPETKIWAQPHMDKEASLRVISLPCGCQGPFSGNTHLGPAVSVMGRQLSFCVSTGLCDTVVHMPLHF